MIKISSFEKKLKKQAIILSSIFLTSTIFWANAYAENPPIAPSNTIPSTTSSSKSTNTTNNPTDTTKNSDSANTSDTNSKYATFESPSYKFKLQYPKKWFYGTVDAHRKNIVRHYEFGPKPIEQKKGIVSLDIMTGVIPPGTSISAGTKTVTEIEKNKKIQIYFTANNKRIYRLMAAPELKAELLEMAASLED